MVRCKEAAVQVSPGVWAGIESRMVTVPCGVGFKKIPDVVGAGGAGEAGGDGLLFSCKSLMGFL
ncbi:MAG: hypothetical protein AAGC54_16105 [Cyanobacteria bacterium P01_F01_bin.4]